MNSFRSSFFVKTLCLLCSVFFYSCTQKKEETYVHIHVAGTDHRRDSSNWLSHEHILVDFIGADSITPDSWNRDSNIMTMLPYVQKLTAHGVEYFVDCTPNYLGGDVRILTEISQRSGIKIVTNTGLYGARNNLFIPSYARAMSPEQLAAKWIDEFENGIDGTMIRPGFIKIGVDAQLPLDTIDLKLVKAGALAHLSTGLTIASHTGPAVGFWQQAVLMKEMGVSPSSFIWAHAQLEEENKQYLKAEKAGYWISFDGLGWELDGHVEKLIYKKENGILDKVLISHDAGWYDPQKSKQLVVGSTALFEKLIPRLYSNGFTKEDVHQLLSKNPARANSVKMKRI